LQWTQRYLAEKGLEEARLSAEVLLAHVLGCKRIDLYTRFDFEPPADKLEAFRRLIRRAGRHEPVAYLVGEKEFYSLPFRVTPAVLIPRPETELLVSEAVSHLREVKSACTAWDVCTGSGCVGVAIAVNVPQATVLATDISPEAVDLAELNAGRHGVAGRVRCRSADLLSLPRDCEDLRPFDAITANPPYVAEGQPIGESVRYEPASALRAGPDGLEVIRPIIRTAPRWLRTGGLLAIEFGCGQAQAVWDLLKRERRLVEPRLLRDHRGVERVATARRGP